jgi:hypothetical protein
MYNQPKSQKMLPESLLYAGRKAIIMALNQTKRHLRVGYLNSALNLTRSGGLFVIARVFSKQLLRSTKRLLGYGSTTIARLGQRGVSVSVSLAVSV